MTSDDISRHIRQLVDTFIDPTLRAQRQLARTPALGQPQPDVVELSRQLKRRTFEILLSHRNESSASDESQMSVYDRLYAACYEKRLNWKWSEADRLSQLVDQLRSTPTASDGVTATLTLLLSLARANDTRLECLGHESWRMRFIGSGSRHPSMRGTTSSTIGRRTYEDIPSSIFEAAGLCAQSESKFEAFNSKLFSMHPGFENRCQPLKCSLPWSTSSASSPESGTTLSRTLFGALLHPLPDPWQIDIKLDLPELGEETLGEEAPPGFGAHRHYYNNRNLQQPSCTATTTSLTDISSTARSDEDEGFVETDSPSSASGRRLAGHANLNDDIWEQAAHEFMLRANCSPAPPPYRTWETLGCAVPQLERPLLGEAGPLALDHVALSQRHQLSILVSGLASGATDSAGGGGGGSFFREIPLCAAQDVLRDAFKVLLGVESTLFPFETESFRFGVAECRCLGLTPEALYRVLNELAKAGTDHFRLEQLVAMVSNTNGQGKVLHGLVGGVRRFLHQKYAVVSDWQQAHLINSNRSGSAKKGGGVGFLSFMEKTATLRKQTHFVADLCMVSSELSGSLPGGIELLAQLHAATVDASSDPHLFPVALTLFRRAAQPYFRFVRAWVFDGCCDDELNEFPIQIVSELSSCKDAHFWNGGFQLVSDTGAGGIEEPVLGPLLHTAFVCGKSLRLLRLCQPDHLLFRQRLPFPTLALTFAANRLSHVEQEIRNYFADVQQHSLSASETAQQLRHSRRQRREAVLERAQQVFNERLRQHESDRVERRQLDADRKRKVLVDLQKQIATNSATTDDYRKVEKSSEETDPPLHGTLVTTDPNTFSDVISENHVQRNLILDEDNLRDDNANTILHAETTTPSLTQVESGDDLNANRPLSTGEANQLPTLRKPNSPPIRHHLKGVKRKQDRESINFDMPQTMRRSPLRTFDTILGGGAIAAACSNGERARRSVVFADEDAAPGEMVPTELVEGSTFQVLRTRGRSVHGHSSDSTIQRLMYGDAATGGGSGSQRIAGERTDELQATATPSLSTEKTLKAFSNLKIASYVKEFPQLNEFGTMSEIFKSSSGATESDQTVDEVEKKSENYRDLRPLPVVLHTCVYQPLLAQAAIVNRSLLDYFLVDCGLQQQFKFIRDHFFLQDGEFAQQLCELLFERVSKVASPPELLNPYTLNSILAKSYSYSCWTTLTSSSEGGGVPTQSPITSDQQNNLSFAVKYIPEIFDLKSPGVLNCLKLVYRTQWPCNIVFAPAASKYYENIFSFLLQLRYCLWALVEAYHHLKANDPAAASNRTGSVRPTYLPAYYRRLQLYRQEMHHFVRSLHEYLNLQAFQIPQLDFERSLEEVVCLDDLMALHLRYLQKISFRCLLHTKAAPLMNTLQLTLSAILTFCSEVALPGNTRPITDLQMRHIHAEYKKFKQQSCCLFEVLTKVVRKGYNPPLQEFLLRLDYNGYYTALLSQAELQLQPVSSDGQRP